MTLRSFRPVQRRRSLAAAVLAVLTSAPAFAGTPAPLYHLVTLDAPGGSAVIAQDINDAGQVVGRYLDADFNARAALWDPDGTLHDLDLPGAGDAAATAINNAGQVVGTFNDYEHPQAALLWDPAVSTEPVVITAGPNEFVEALDIGDGGEVVGGFGLPAQERAFVWTGATGLVDYGLQDEGLEFQQARWSAVNASGRLVGHWNQHSSNVHATVGDVGVASVMGMSKMSEAFASIATAVNDAGVVVGLGLAIDAPKLVPVVLDADGFSEIAGATLDQDNGCAAAINASGTIVGSAGIGSASGCVPGLKAWVRRDGTVYDLYDVVDDHGPFTRFQIARAINADGVIVGAGLDADEQVRSFKLVPIGDTVFADGFDG
ncbi:MAG: hypothetical protein ACTHK2_01515 [Dokdonella sp.]|uniref:hypothetical protein n=1 Tax=Dokdonella sp. TaxID=2291710 RepID=UPI003F7FF722